MPSPVTENDTPVPKRCNPLCRLMDQSARRVLLSRFSSFRAHTRSGREGRDMAAPTGRGKMLLAVTNSIVGLHREHYGRGATRGRTIMQDDYLVCFLEDLSLIHI